MPKELWINLPVKDVKKSRDFFTALGFLQDTTNPSNDHRAGILIGDKHVPIMLFEESMFKGFTRNDLMNTATASEVLFSFDADSRAEVDEMARKVKAAGGTVFSEPAEVQGWMYGFGFADLDGHRWNMLYMDSSKMPL